MRLLQVLAVGLGLGIGTLANAAGKVQKIATVEVNVKDGVAENAAGIRTLFVIVFDQDSPMPRPWGAMKVDLKADAKGTIYKGDLTTDNTMVMAGPGSPIPKKLRFKARLDKNGSADPDQAGDAIGTILDVAPGGSTKILIDTTVK